MKKDDPLSKLGLPRMRLRSALDDLGPPPGVEAGLPGSGRDTFGNTADAVASRMARSQQPTPPAPVDDPRWETHKRFQELRTRHGKAFERFVGDVIDIILAARHQQKIVDEQIDKAVRRRQKRDIDPLSPDGAIKAGGTLPDTKKVTIGGEPPIRPRHYLHRKEILAALFLDPTEYQGHLELRQLIEQVTRAQCDHAASTALGPEGRRTELHALADRLREHITREDLIKAWALLELDGFAELEWIYSQAQQLYLVRPGFYEELDQAYREAKRMLKLMQVEFERGVPTEPGQREAILDYLREVLTVYSHHHWVLKRFNFAQAAISRHQVETERRDLEARLATARTESGEAKSELARVRVLLEAARGEAAQSAVAQKDMAVRLKRLEADATQKQLRDLEAQQRRLSADLEALNSDNAQHRIEIRDLLEENQRLTDQLRKLHVFPDDKSVAGLLAGQRVVIFGGIGKDHYWPTLNEAGVSLEDYEWWEGYQTISQARTDEIVGRCDLVVLITCYCGHLILFQTRDSLKNTDKQVIRIHNSGAGSLRHHLLERFGKKKGT